jgi:hypothetical protein
MGLPDRERKNSLPNVARGQLLATIRSNWSSQEPATSQLMKKDLAGGLLMILFGAGAVIEGQRHTMGTLTRMGTGYFPVILGCVLALIGVMIVLGSFFPSETAEDDNHGEIVHAPDWRGCIAIVGGLVAFVVLGEYLGLAAATFAGVFISATGDREFTVKSALFLASGMTAIATVVFWYLLQVQFPIVRW